MSNSEQGSMDLHQFRSNGYLICEHALPPARVAALRQAYLRDLAEKVARFGLRPAPPRAEICGPQQVLNDFAPRGGNHDINRWNMHLPSVETYLSPDLVANSRVLAVVHALMGRDAVAYLVASDTPYPGSAYQNVHQDFSRFSLALNVPLVDFTEENGPLEVWPGTHRRDLNDAGESFSRAPHSIGPEKMRELAERVRPHRLLARAGSMVLRDHRLMHRGTANTTQAARPMLSIYYTPPHAVPPRWMADAGAWAAKKLRVVGRGAGDEVRHLAIFGLGNVLGRVVEECSLSDRDYRRAIPRALWDQWPEELRTLLRFARVEGMRAPRERASAAGAAHFARECWSNTRESLVSAWRGTARRPDRSSL